MNKKETRDTIVVLKKIKKYMIKKPGHYPGMCAAARWVHEYDYQKEEIFTTYYQSTIKRRRVFYESNGRKIKDSAYWMFPRHADKPRLNWLTTHIELLTKTL